MRSHLLCNKKMEQFPSVEKHALPAIKTVKLQLYCHCKMLEGNDNMAFYPKCSERYTTTSVNKYIFENKCSKYICSKCC